MNSVLGKCPKKLFHNPIRGDENELFILRGDRFTI
jgi:hypothetical protein